jgi:hypothetical protein
MWVPALVFIVNSCIGWRLARNIVSNTNAKLGARTMLSLSYGRLLIPRSVWAVLIAMAVLLSLAACAASHRSGVTDASRPPNVISADTDSVFTGATTQQPRRSGGGYSVSGDQLEMEEDFRLASILVAHFPGIRVVHDGQLDRVASGLNMNMTGAPCYLQIFVDGVFIANGGVEWLNVRNIDSIEYRTPGNIPVQYQNRLPDAMCGMLLFWSKTS